MFHLVNGDATRARLPASLPGTVAVWRDVLIEGPAADLDIATLAERRAPWLEQRLGIAAAEYVASGRAQVQALASAAEHDEIVLWFEQDLFCVANLAHLAAWLRRSRPSASVSLVFPKQALGTLHELELSALFDARRPLDGDAISDAAAWWQAYCSAVPVDVPPTQDRLPFLGVAWRLHLTRFPSTTTGLGAVESAVVATLGTGPRRFTDVFRTISTDERMRPLGMSDLQLAAYVRALAVDGPTPLVRIDGADTVTSAAVQAWEISVTAEGRAVGAGLRDRLEVQPLDWWLGGVHLEGHRVSWRWDPAARELVRA